jgi:hypothetical protein
MVRYLFVLLTAAALILSATSAFADAGDCNGDGALDDADLEAIIAANNSLAAGTSLEACDYDGDGAISLADANEHIAQSKQQ